MKPIVIAIATMALLTFACKKTDEVVTGSAETATVASTSEIPGTASPNDLNPVRAQMFVDDFTIGHEVGADGMIPTGKTGDDFAPGQMVYLTMKVKDAPATTAVKAVFYGPGEKVVGEETKKVAGGEKFMTFTKGTKGWPKGDYRVDTFVGDEKVNSQQFQIVPPAGAGK